MTLLLRPSLTYDTTRISGFDAYAPKGWDAPRLKHRRTNPVIGEILPNIKIALVAMTLAAGAAPALAAADTTDAVAKAALRYCLDGRRPAKAVVAQAERDGGKPITLRAAETERAFSLPNGLFLSVQKPTLTNDPKDQHVVCTVLGKGAERTAVVKLLSKALNVTFAEDKMALSGLGTRIENSFLSRITDPADPLFSVSIFTRQDVPPGQRRLGNKAALGFALTVGYAVAGPSG